MSFPNPSTALASVVVDELVRAGVVHLVASPGSRSTALALAAAARSELTTTVAIDERSAGFHALGAAKASGRAAAVVTTSGTAVANLMAAVVEADAAGVPLVVLTADRPPEARSVGANQTIDQVGLFGHFVRRVVELGPGEYTAAAPRWWRSAMSQALAAATGWGGRPGPVQVDVAFREPTVGVSDDGRSRADPYPFDQEGRTDGRQWTETLGRRMPAAGVVHRLGEAVSRSRRGVIVAGAGAPPELPALGAHLGWPVVATAESGLRRGGGVVASGHHLLAAPVESPDMIMRFGPPGPSRRVVELVSGDVPQAVVGDGWSDPGRTAHLLVDGDGAALVEAIMHEVPAQPATAWTAWWEAADAAVRTALAPELAAATEPGVAATVSSVAAGPLVVASSMPIRDVEAYGFDAPSVVANRGASGIDGAVSVALGTAAATGPGLALIGDLSLLHDSNGFLVQPRPGCVFVVVDNGGGGIFSFLPQAEHVGAEFERLFATPPGRDLSVLAEFHGLEFRRAQTAAEVVTAAEELAGTTGLVVVRTDRSANVAEHLRLERLAGEAAAGVDSPA